MALIDQLKPLLGAQHIIALYGPLVHPRSFFSRLEERSSKISPAVLLFVWGCLIGLIGVVFLNQGPDVSIADRGSAPPAIAEAIVAAASILFSGIGGVLITFLPALWLHVILRVMGATKGKNALPAWQMVAFITVSLMIATTLLAAIRLIPAAGEALFIVLTIAILLASARSLWIAITEVYGAGPVKASLAAILSIAPLALLFFFLSVAS